VFVASFEILHDKLSIVPTISESPLLTSIVDELKDQVIEIKKEWLSLHGLYPEVYSSIQTRHAVQSIILYEAKDIDELFKRGLFDDTEYTKMAKSLLMAQHKLYFDSFYYVSSISSSEQDKKQTLLSMIFMSKLQKNTARYQEKINYLFKEIESHIYNKNDIIIKKGQKCDPEGLYILVSGTASVVLSDDNVYKKELNLTKGTIIGGYAYLTATPYLTTVYSMNASDVFFIEDKVFKYLLNDEKEAFISLWRQIATNVMLTKFWRNNTSFFAFYGKTDISRMCQQSTFKHFKSTIPNKRTLVLNEGNMALLLDGNAFIDPTQKSKIFKSPDILLPSHKTYYLTQNAKLIIFDHKPNAQKNTLMLAPQKSRRLKY